MFCMDFVNDDSKWFVHSSGLVRLLALGNTVIPSLTELGFQGIIDLARI